MSDTNNSRDPVSGHQRSRPRVLVVDDSSSHKKLMELLAEKFDIFTHCASSGKIGAEYFAIHQYDAVLMDYSLPDMNGLECARMFRRLEKKSGRHTPIIAVSAYSAGTLGKFLDAGMDDYLAKPFTLQQLRQKLCQWLDMVLD
jgi:CheY-like chemotaxis protein